MSSRSRFLDRPFIALGVWAIGPYLALSGLAGLVNGGIMVAENRYLQQGLDYLAVRQICDQVGRDLLAALLSASALLAVALLAYRRGWRPRTILPLILAVEVCLIVSRFLYHEAWAVTMPAFGIPLPGFLWRRSVVFWTVGLLSGGLVLLAIGLRAASMRYTGEWMRPRATAALLPCFAVAILLGAGAATVPLLVKPHPVSRPTHILWISWDSVRADHTSSYGYGRLTTPNLDRLASESVLFETAVSLHNWTRPSYSSMFTSRGVWEFPGSHLQLQHQTLAETLRNHGYRTIGFVQNPNLDAELHMNQGFESYYQLPGRTTPPAMNAAALNRLRDLAGSGDPVFLFLHYQQPHYPYSPENPFRDQFLSSHGARSTEAETSSLMFNHGRGWNADAPDADEKLQYLLESYDSEIRFADEGLGEFLAAIRELGIFEDSLIIVNSDHGDEFFDHGSFGHAHRNLHPELTSVPQVIRFPDQLGIRPTRFLGVVQSWDLFPTILSVIGVDAPPEIAGRALYPLPEPMAQDRMAISTQSGLIAIRTRKTTIAVDFGRDAATQLYDLATDPLEKSPIADRESHPDYSRLKTTADAWHSAFGQFLDSQDERPAMSRELQERLRGLGYLQ